MIRAFALLFRLKLSALNGISALAGYAMLPSPLEAIPACAAFGGVFLLAAGGSAVNQVMERDLDATMARTRQRPLPSGRLTASQALAGGVIAIGSGLLLLVIAGDWKPALCGAAALAWYLRVYTPLKRLSSLALLAGAVCGAFPPLIGWCLGGGYAGDYRVIILASLLFLWQVPHFWLFQRRHAEDYRRAGIPLFGSRGVTAGTSGFFWLWMVALCAGAMLMPAFNIIERPGSLWYALFPVPLLFLAFFRSGDLLFPYINCFPLLVTLLLMVQKHY